MLKEAIELIVKLGRDSESMRQVRIPGDHDRVLVGPDLVEYRIPPEPRRHTVRTVEDLGAAAKREAAHSGISVWHDDERVVLVLDEATRREWFEMPLQVAATFKTLRGLETSYLFAQRDLLSLLRVELSGCNVSSELIQGLRKLKFRSSAEVRGEIGHARESLGRDVDAEIVADIALPERIEIDSAVYTNPGEDAAWPVVCMIDPQPLVQKILFRPLPGDLDEAVRQAQRGLRGRLEATMPEGTPIYYGQPSLVEG